MARRDSKFVVVYVLVLIMLLLIPACGYFGARRGGARGWPLGHMQRAV